MGRIAALLTLVILSFGCGNAVADVYDVSNSSSGWYDQTGCNVAHNFNYYSGNLYSYCGMGDLQFNDYFSFDLSGVSGTVVSASFSVDAYDVVGSGTYSIYTTNLTPAGVGGGCTGCVATYDDLTSGSLIDTISVTPADAYTILTIDFNSAGLAWLTANEGMGIVLGGSEPQPADSLDAVFSGSNFNAANALDITTASTSVPEPSSFVMLGAVLLGVLGGIRRRLQA